MALNTETIYLEPEDVRQLVVQFEMLMENSAIITLDTPKYVKLLNQLYRLDDQIHCDPPTGELYFRNVWDDRDKDEFHRLYKAEEDDSE